MNDFGTAAVTLMSALMEMLLKYYKYKWLPLGDPTPKTLGPLKALLQEFQKFSFGQIGLSCSNS